MGKGKRGARRKQRANPRGIIEINRNGYGFVKTAEGDFFIPRTGVGEAFDGDLVEVSHMHRRRNNGRNHSEDRPEAKVVRVLERAHADLVGIYELNEPFGIVVPDDPRIHHDIFTKATDAPHVEDGSLVRVAIDQYPTRRSAATGHIIEVLGTGEDAFLSSERIIARNNIRHIFPEDVLLEAEALSVDAKEAFASGYRDIRSRFTFTIDPDDAKDFDDAISIEAIEEYGGLRCAWRLGVHIADVANYVPWRSAIDGEARKRGTSVYLADRVVPMLPEKLSNDICSLKPGEDRRCVTVDIYIDDRANLVTYEIYEAVMNSDIRLTYSQALDILEGRICEPVESLRRKLEALNDIACRRRHIREGFGGIDFNTKEAKVRLDEQGHAVGIDIRRRNAATELIEESMIFANEIVASYLDDTKTPAAFRVHEQPHLDSLADAVNILQEFKWFNKSLAAKVLAGDPFAIQKVLSEVRGRAEEQLIESLMIRSMARAVYSPFDGGHYGLGLSSYCHFTSPIRRYPDLIVHRMLKESLSCASGKTRAMVQRLPALCEHCSATERAAEVCARESVEAKIVEYLSDSVGCTFEAVVSGVMTYGLYVQLDCTAEGLVPIRDIGNEYFIFEASQHQIRGSETGTIYRLGQKVDVVLVEADTKYARLTFGIAKKRRKQVR